MSGGNEPDGVLAARADDTIASHAVAPAPDQANRDVTACAFPRGHIPALDGVRGLAVALIMAFHIFAEAKPVATFERTLVDAVRSGWLGVDLFSCCPVSS